MKRLLEYIIESLLFESEEGGVNEPDSKENQEKLKNAAKQIFNLLKKKENLKDYVEALNGILDSSLIKDKDNTQLYLNALVKIFSGQGDPDNDAYNKYTCKGDEDIEVSNLYPTQSEIDIANSAKWATKDWGAKGVADMFSGKGFGSTFPVPVLIYNDGSKNWIIDGHHRWSQVALINPKGKLHCMVIQGKESAQEFLKLVQSVIAGVTAARNKGEKLPVGEANPDNNIFGKALKGDKLKEKVIEMFTKNTSNAKTVWEILMKNNIMNKQGELVTEKLDEHLQKIIDSLGELVMKNRDKMIENGQAPEKWAEPRPVMPQSDRAGQNGSEDSGADKEGSALNKLKNVKALPNL